MNKYFELLTKGTGIKIITIKKCKYCLDDFALFDLEKKLLDNHGFKDTMQCSTCTFRMLNSYLNDRHLYIREDSESGKNIISILSSDYKGKVIEAKNYNKLLFDDLGLKFGRDISDNIFLDFKNLYENFPKPSRLIYPGLENAEYSSHVGWAKNLYLSYCVFTDCEDIFYSKKIVGGVKNTYNSYNITTSSNIYFSLLLGNCHNVSYSNNCEDSSDLIFCTNMNNCSKCIFCSNQVNVKYRVFNKQYSKEEYIKIKDDVLKRFKKLEHNYYNFLDENYISSSTNINNSEGVVGADTFYSKNSVNTFNCIAVENSINIFNVGDNKSDHNVNLMNSIEAGTNCENFLGVCSTGSNVYNIFFSKFVVESKNIYYGIDIEGCEEIMWSIGLRHKKYCILNKQYTKEEYFELKIKIINDLKKQDKWGDYLGFGIVGYPYNDTLAYDYFKVNKVILSNGDENIIDKNAKGIVKVYTDDFISDAELDLGGEEKIKIKWRTKDKEININDNMNIIYAKDLPDIDEVANDILEKTIICEESGRPFRIIKQELDFLKNKGFPLPRVHHELRIDKLLEKRPIGQMFLGISDLSQKNILTIFKNKPKYKVYSPDEYKDFMYK